jgi:phage terminase small subunit
MSKQPPKKGARELTDKQRAFVETYLSNGRKAAAAYRLAYNPNASPRRASEEAARLLKHPLIAPMILQVRRKAENAIARAADHCAATQERIVTELARVGFASMGDYVRITLAGDAQLDLSQVDDDQWKAISKLTIEEKTEGTGNDTRVTRKVRIKLHDKRAALVDLARIQGFIVDRKKISGVGGAPIETPKLGCFGRELMRERFLEISRRREAEEAERFEKEVERRLAARTTAQ